MLQHSRLNSFLEGVRILDLSLFLPGPLTTLLLADMGADVVKIEPPDGDGMMFLGPRDDQGRGIFYNAVNAGKSVRRLDLKSERGRTELLRLATQADVLLEGFRPGVMQRLGIGYEAVRTSNPAIVYCSLSGFGASGSLATTAAHDANFLALSGALYRNGTDRPVYYDPPVVDSAGSLFAMSAILAALHASRRDGKGCLIDLALADAVMPLQLFEIAAYARTGRRVGPGATYLNGGAAYYQVYRTRDGRHVVLGAVEEKFWKNFCTAAGRPDWAARQSEALPQERLMADVAGLLGALTLAECLARFDKADCCLAPVLDMAEALDSPHYRERGLVRNDGGGNLQALFPALVNGLPPDTRPPQRCLDDGLPVTWPDRRGPSAADEGD